MTTLTDYSCRAAAKISGGYGPDMTGRGRSVELTRLNASLEGRYSLRGELGRGGMAVVYLAEDLKHRRDVAVKVFSPEVAQALGRDRFIREIDIAAKLNHPNILPLLDSGEVDECLFYVMPHVVGPSLRTKLRAEGQIAIDEALRLTGEVAAALNHAHSRNLVHRDIKPENILLHEGIAMVTDFGIARAVTDVTEEPLTRAGMMVGTVLYMSPEQTMGATDIDARSDLYSLGCVLYEMLLGEAPFTGESVASVISKRLTEPPLPLPYSTPDGAGRGRARRHDCPGATRRGSLSLSHGFSVGIERAARATTDQAGPGSAVDRRIAISQPEL